MTTQHNTPAALLTKTEAAKQISMSKRSLDNLIAAKAIACVRIGRSVRFHPDAIQAFISSHTVNASA